ncbi:MAG: DNA polymerase III subunit gamma/tau [Evtepia sp.]
MRLYQALYRKWRPRSFEDVVGQAHITDTLKQQVETERTSHAYLFTGSRGTGKTTCAKILSRAVNCEHPVNGNPCNVCPSCLGIENGSIMDVVELDAASNNGVENVRALRDEAIYTPGEVKKRVYIIDEVHMLSMSAFNALLKILEEPPPHLMFILATTELHKVPATIKSRCQKFAFKRILPFHIAARLCFVAEQEQISLTAEAADLLSRLADGGLRDALSLLDQCAGSGQTLDETQVLDVLGLAGNLEIMRLLNLIAVGDTDRALARVGVLYHEGKDMAALLGEISDLVRDVLIKKTAPKGGESLLTGGYEANALSQLESKFTSAELAQMLTMLQNALSDLYRSSHRRTDAELCIIRLSERQLARDWDGILARLSRLELQMQHAVPAAREPQTTVEPQTIVEPVRQPPIPPPEQKPQLEKPAIEKPAVNASQTWSGFLATLRGKIPQSAYTFINQSGCASGIFDAHGLTIWVESEMTKGLLGKADVHAALEKAATAYAGHPLRVSFRLGKPEQSVQPEKEDKLDELLTLGRQFDNVTIK